MTKGNVFIKSRYYDLCIPEMGNSMAIYTDFVIFALIAGQFTGEYGIIAICVCYPIFGIASALASLSTYGAVEKYYQYKDNGDMESANAVFAAAVIIAALIGIISCAAMGVFTDNYLAFLGVSQDTSQLALDLIRYMKFMWLIYPVCVTLKQFANAEGDASIVSAFDFAITAGSLVIPVSFAYRMGIAGIGFGELIVYLIGMAVVMLHYIKPESQLKLIGLKAAALPRKLAEMIAANILDFFGELTSGIYRLIIIIFVLRKFGEEFLIPVGIMMATVPLSVLLGFAVEAAYKMMIRYYTERNFENFRKVGACSLKTSLLLSVCACALMYILVPYVPQIFGLNWTAYFAYSMEAVKCAIIALPFTIALYFMMYWLAALGHAIVSLAAVLLLELVLPALLPLVLMRRFGIGAVWKAVAITAIAVCMAASVYTLLFMLIKKPLRHKEGDGRIFNYAFRVSPQAIMPARDAAEAFLKKTGTESIDISKVMLLIEEWAGEVLARKKSKRVFAEYTIYLYENSLKIILRDSEKYFNIKDGDGRLTGLGTYIIFNMAETALSAKYEADLNYSRNVLELKLSSQKETE